MPLDEAIVRAVERGKSTEVKRRLYGTILLIGGVARTPGLLEYLEWRISVRALPQTRASLKPPPYASALSLRLSLPACARVRRAGPSLPTRPRASSVWRSLGCRQALSTRVLCGEGRRRCPS